MPQWWGLRGQNLGIFRFLCAIFLFMTSLFFLVEQQVLFRVDFGWHGPLGTQGQQSLYQ